MQMTSNNPHENTSGFGYVHTQYMTHMYMTQMQELDNQVMIIPNTVSPFYYSFTQ